MSKLYAAICAVFLLAAPLAASSPLNGQASWYNMPGKRTASGEIFRSGSLTAAHKSLPFGTKVRVTHNDKSVVVRINDRGPFNSRIIDLSKAAANQIGLVHRGHGTVNLQII